MEVLPPAERTEENYGFRGSKRRLSGVEPAGLSTRRFSILSSSVGLFRSWKGAPEVCQRILNRNVAAEGELNHIDGLSKGHRSCK